jgi:REP element-mobilizing transposase RayT
MTLPPRGSKELRKGRFSQAGGFYFVTTSTFEKEKVFTRPEIVRILVESILWMEKSGKWAWSIYMIMADHVHLVFQLENGESLASVMKAWKGYTARMILMRSGQECPSHKAEGEGHPSHRAEDGQECPADDNFPKPEESQVVNLCGRGLQTPICKMDREDKKRFKLGP